MTDNRALLRNETSSPPDVIPGVVDGLVTTSFEPDGSACLHVVIGAYGAVTAGCEQIEFILRPEHAKMLGATLLGERLPYSAAARHETGSVPCRIGVRLNPLVP